MSIITGKEKVAAIYKEAAKRGWVIPCFCTENLTTTEAILSASSEFAEENHLLSVPITLAVTVQYVHRPQAVNYTHTRKWDTGLKLFYADAVVLADSFKNVDILLHLDHIQHDLDEELLESDLRGYSSIMYDASNLPLNENIVKTRAFVEKKGKDIFIEGACDEIIDADGDEVNIITSPEKCEHYLNQSGVDMVVANLGTEHRASSKDLRYHGDAAKSICQKIGHKIVLHGTSSVSSDQIGELFNDGVCKVNIWTALERDVAPELVKFIVENANRIAGSETVEDLISKGYLTEKCSTGEKASIAVYTTLARQEIVFKAMKKIVREYLDMWYKL